jgi:membrane-associated phospholipid phosphatase
LKKILTVALVIILALVSQYRVWAQSIDSTYQKPKWYKSKAFNVLLAPTLLATSSLVLFDPNGGEHTIISDIPGFKTVVDDYLQFAPIAIVYGLDIAGVDARNDVLNQSLMLVKAELIMAALVFPLKSITAVPRPDGNGDDSFPSGHTAQAFLSATFMHKEFGHLSAWYSIGAYAMATTTGVFRILKNRHRLTDVLMGAGIGILSVNLAYATHRYRWGKQKKHAYKILPTYNRGSLGVYFSYKL